MDVTVAICTHRRADQLERTLTAMCELEVASGVDWRLLVVANACAAPTFQVLESFEDELPLRWVREDRKGHSHARNRAVEEAEGDLIVWTDDDVRVDPGWLTAYVRAYRRWPEAVFFGGPIEPSFQGEAPDWLTETFRAFESVRSAYAARDLGDEPAPITSRERLPYGANMALPVDVQRRHRFDPALGRSGTDLVGGDEVTVLEALLADGRTGRWVPEARVEHVIPPERQSLSYLRRYFRDQGRVAEPRPEDEPVPRLFGRPRWALRARVEEEVRYRLERLVGDPVDWMPHLIAAGFAEGALAGPPEPSHRRG